MYELTQVMRQKGDARFAELLNKMREGYRNAADYALLATREVPAGDDVPHLFAFHEPREVHNSRIMHAFPGNVVLLNAIDVPMGHTSLAEKTAMLAKA